jgi:hypothetical protein
MTITVTERDLRALLSVVRDHRDEDAGDGLPLSLLQHLMIEIPSDAVTFMGLDSRRQEAWFGQGVPADGEDEDDDTEAFWAHCQDCLPCSYPDRSGDLLSITRNSDFYSARQWHSTGMYTDYLRPAGIENELMLCLPGAPQRTVRLVFFRGPGLDFTERDRALLALLRPHLQEAYVEAEMQRRGAHQRPDLPAAGRDRGHRAQAPGEHLQPAPGVQPRGCRQPRVRPRRGRLTKPSANEVRARPG